MSEKLYLSHMIRLGVNIDHVATLREVRKSSEPDILAAANEALKGGADSITVHLREDERHIKEADVRLLRSRCTAPLNLEMSTDSAVLAKALDIIPNQATLVPERRLEVTTERGLDLLMFLEKTRLTVRALQDKGILVSLFIDPDPEMLRLVRKTGTDRIEIHTGQYASAFGTPAFPDALERIRTAADICRSEGIKIHAGHGLSTANILPLLEALLPAGLEEVNIGHSLVCRAVFVGLAKAVAEMKHVLTEACRQ
jgi:pyridoxine 5-phosphate synthase